MSFFIRRPSYSTTVKRLFRAAARLNAPIRFDCAARSIFSPRIAEISRQANRYLIASCPTGVDCDIRNPMAARAVHIIVHGRVQGVGFRYFVRNTAVRFNICGNVQNCDDGTVEIVAEGNPRRLQEFIQELEKGPALSRVVRLDLHDMPAEGNYSNFHIEGW
jgi:acylphosphatase